MAILDYFKFNRRVEERTEIPGVSKVGDAYLVDSFSFATQNSLYPDTSMYYNRVSTYIPFGKDNLFPNQLVDLFYSSPIHSTIVKMKKLIMSGNGFDLSNKSVPDLIKFAAIIDNPTSQLGEWSLDYQLLGAMVFEVTWNINFTQISKIKRLPAMSIRLGLEDESGVVNEYYYSRDWRHKVNGYEKVYAKFDPNDKKNYKQILYVKNSSVDGRYYGIPNYISGLNYIAANAAISKYHLSVVENGFNPGLAIKFYKKPSSPEERDAIVRNIKKEYSGKNNAGKAMIFFSDGKDLAPDVQAIEVSNLDKQFTVLSEDITNQILYSHQAVSPILYGIKTPGQLGNTQEFQNAYKILDKAVLEADRKVFEEAFNSILKVNNISPITIKPFVIFEENITTQ